MLLMQSDIGSRRTGGVGRSRRRQETLNFIPRRSRMRYRKGAISINESRDISAASDQRFSGHHAAAVALHAADSEYRNEPEQCLLADSTP
jgi:hypothetical protein